MGWTNKALSGLFKRVSKYGYPFLQDLYCAFRNERYLMLHYFDANYAHSFAMYRAMMFLRSNLVEGDVYEFGVATGRTATIMGNLLTARSLKHHFGASRLNLFDSFEGFPEITGVDGYTNKFRQGGFKETSIDPTRLGRRLTRLVGEERVNIVKGYYTPELIRDNAGGQVALLHVDCDLYLSTKIVLDALRDRLQDGTVILFDDYWFYRGRPDMGEQKAMREFFANDPDLSYSLWFSYGFHGQAVVVHGKAPEAAA